MEHSRLCGKTWIIVVYCFPLPRAIFGHGEFAPVGNSVEPLIFHLSESLGRLGLEQGCDKDNVSQSRQVFTICILVSLPHMSHLYLLVCQVSNLFWIKECTVHSVTHAFSMR